MSDNFRKRGTPSGDGRWARTTQLVGCAIGGISVGLVMKTILPFYSALIAALLLVTDVPVFSLGLPRLSLGKF